MRHLEIGQALGAADLSIVYDTAVVSATACAADPDGEFDLSTPLVARDPYILEGRKNDDYRTGVTISDLVKIQQHILNVHLLNSPHQLLAADADRSFRPTDV